MTVRSRVGSHAAVGWFKTDSDRVADGLEAAHDEILRLARQIEYHSELAPYPFMAERLKRISDDEERNARRIGERLMALGRQPLASSAGAIRTGRNSWERLIQDSDDYRALLRRLSQLWVRWDDESSEDAAVVRSVLDASTRNRDDLNDLVARSDPHALD